jgi:hypothetical protein
MAGRAKKYKKNRASQSGGDQKARGIFELSTTVGLRRTSEPDVYRIRIRNLLYGCQRTTVLRHEIFYGVITSSINHRALFSSSAFCKVLFTLHRIISESKTLLLTLSLTTQYQLLFIILSGMCKRTIGSIRAVLNG